jgi:sulfur-oxidizing protein SoxY
MTDTTFNRRRVLAGAGTGLFAAACLNLLPTAAQATPAETEDLVKKLTGGAKLANGRITLKVPQIAENGNTVPFTVMVDSPMTEADHVKAIHVLAEENPWPGVASFTLGPDVGKAEVSMRMRLAKTQNVRAVAVMSDGSVWQVSQEVKVTIGGCGG